MNFKTPYNAKPEPGETNDSPSVTVPDQTMSIQEIVRRFQQGLPMTGQRVPVYNGDENLPDFDRMDLAEIQDYRVNIKNEMQQLQRQYEIVTQAQANADRQKLIAAAAEKLQKQKDDETTKLV